MGRIKLAYHEPLDRNLSKIGQDEEFGSLGPLVACQADETSGWCVFMLIQNVEPVGNLVRIAMDRIVMV